MDLRAVFGTSQPVVGMVHLPALPGAPGNELDRDALRRRARSDATALADGGVDAVLVENFGDAPFYPDDVPKHVVASMTDLTRAVMDTVECPVGVNVLRNDAEAALAVAAATGATFVRVNVHVGARVTDQGLIEGRAYETVRHRDQLSADVAILADVDVKHSTSIGPEETAAASVADTVERGLADGVIVTGSSTGDGPSRAAVETVVDRRDRLDESVPVFVGSGVTPETVGPALDVADGVIVGTALKGDGQPSNPVDPDRVSALVSAAGR